MCKDLETITFGERTGIEWIILTQKENKCLLLAKNIVYAKRFDKLSNDYKNSEIRKWLNHEFFWNAFTDEERKRICPTLLENSIEDLIFLLSIYEIKTYLKDYRAWGTKAAIEDGLYTDAFSKPEEACSPYWLRDMDEEREDMVFYVNVNGEIDKHYLRGDFIGVRPALWITLK